MSGPTRSWRSLRPSTQGSFRFDEVNGYGVAHQRRPELWLKHELSNVAEALGAAREVRRFLFGRFPGSDALPSLIIQPPHVRAASRRFARATRLDMRGFYCFAAQNLRRLPR